MKTVVIGLCIVLSSFLTAQESLNLETFVLRNGLKVYFIKYGKIEAINVKLMINSGKKNETPGQQGYSNLTAELLLEGNAKYTKAEQSDRAFALGATLSTASDNDYTTIEGDFLSSGADAAIDLMSAAILQPKFDKDVIDRYKSYLIDNNQPAKMDIAQLASIFSDYAIFGLQNPLGRQYYKAQIQEMTPEKIRGYYAFNYTPKNARLVITGNADVAAVKTIVEKYFANWQSTYGEVNGVVLDRPQIKKREYGFIHRANATQCALQWNKTGPSSDDKEAMAFRIANSLFNDVLFAEIREKGGKTYGISAVLNNSRYADVLTITCSVRNTELLSTLTLFDKTLSDFYGTTIDPVKFAEAVNTLKVRILSTETPSEIAGLFNPVKFNFEKRKSLLTDLGTLKPEDVQRVIKKYFTPDSYKLVIAGDESMVADQLNQIKGLQKFKAADLERIQD